MTKDEVESIKMQEDNNLALTYMSRGKKKKERKNLPNIMYCLSRDTGSTTKGKRKMNRRNHNYCLSTFLRGRGCDWGGTQRLQRPW